MTDAIVEQGDVQLPPLDVTEEDKSRGLQRGLPKDLMPDDLMDVVGWWTKILTALGGIAECRERQLAAALRTIADLQAKLEGK